MFSFVPGVPDLDDLRSLARKVDTARHHGVPNGCVLELDLLSAPPETSGFDPMAIIGGGGRPLVLRETVAAIHRAAEDDRVAGLIARVQLPAAAAGPVQELRDAIAAFSDVKPSIAWAETYPGTLSYYLASAFREVWMQPSGTVGLVGFATSALFLRDALDKVGIEAQFIARGEYKSAANLFTQDRYTDAHREADSRLLDSLHGQVWQAVAKSRHIDPAAVDELADKAPLLRDDAVTGRLVDRIGFRDEAYARISEFAADARSTNRFGALGISPKTGGADDPDAPPRLYLSRYAKATASRPGPQLPSIPGRKSKPTIAVVTLHGSIVSGKGGPQVLPFGNSSVGGDTIAAALREAAADDSVSAIVLRVDSPGGSVTGSETIWREVNRVRDGGKPVVASMGAVAASGGYYVSMGADAIVANAGTITGSIGVVTGKLVARELKDRIGVGSDSVRTNENADAWSIDQAVHRRAARSRRGRGRPVLHRLHRARRAGPQAQRGGGRRGGPRAGVDRRGRARAGPGRRARRTAHRDQPGQGAGRARRGRRRAHRQLPGLVAVGLPPTQAVVAARRGVPVRGRRGAARPIGGGDAGPGRAVADRGERVVVGRLPVLKT